MFPTLTLIDTGRKRLDLIKKTAFLLAFKEAGSGAIPIGSVRNLHQQRTSVRSAELVFLFLLLLFNCFSHILSLLVLFDFAFC